jgi:deazaflavin-dependent oxidoreductase (nitroreductase family)
MKMNVKLITTGRRTGEPRRVTLYGYEDGDRMVVVGSAGGAAEDPAWVGNLRAQSRATLRNGRDVREVRAIEVDSAGRERLWALVTKAFPLYETYQGRTERVIPMFVLETVDAA